ncbi:MAG TPA: glucose-6-phosphate isomerase, partial [Lacibacter sp.]|nr:glucose-6-phosphate isomerase [Lacibacter sp.]HMO90302.1 glucose-6-phosphate isomerase [Lacibacter sp.]
MLPAINPTTTAAWQQLSRHAEAMKSIHLRELFRQDPNRFTRFSCCAEDLVLDYSKNRITPETLQLLRELAEACGIPGAVRDLFAGEKINHTENRAVLHTALRNFSDQPVYVDGTDVMPDVKRVLAHMQHFCQRIHSGAWKGYTGKPIRFIVNIGIGGSDLGPVMVTEALKPYWV